MDKIISSKNDYKIEEKDKLIDININDEKWQEKLTAGENIKIDENNTISATAGSTDLTDYYKKEEVDKKLEDTKALFPIAFQIYVITSDVPTLETENKTVSGAINEINKKQPSGSSWKDVAFSQDRETIIYELKTNTHYRIFYDVNNKRSIGLIGKYPCLISEFYWIYTDGSSFNDLWINLPHWKDTNLSHLVIVINQHKISWKNNSNDGNFWKLQELQE